MGNLNHGLNLYWSHQMRLLVAARAEVECAAQLLAVDVRLLDASRVR